MCLPQDESAWSLCHSLECDILARRPLRLMTRLIARVLLALDAFTSIAENREGDANRRPDNRVYQLDNNCHRSV